MTPCLRRLAILLALLLASGPLRAGAPGPAALPVVPPVIACAALAEVPLDAIGGAESRITDARETTSDGIPVCAVAGTLAPAVGFQILLPLETWAQRYLQVGCGGLCGRITLASGASDGCAVLAGGGFAMAATDMGHADAEAGVTGADWGLDAQRRIDFAHRAQHVTALAARALIRAFYGKDPAFSYFNGCSDGGREAIMAALRYPSDFDGIIAGAPAMLFTVQNTLHHGWLARGNTGADGRAIVTSDRLPLIHAAVMAACDGTDGVTDGLIAQPALCHPDLSGLVCRAGQDPAGCLSAAEAEVVRKVHDGPRDAATGDWLTAGSLLPGSELNWQGVFVPDSAGDGPFSARIAEPVLRSLAFDPPRPDMTLADLDFTSGTLAALRSRHRLFDATSPDLAAFHAAGGKLILWHGLADPHIAPATTVAWYKAVQDRMGAAVAQEFVRLYLLPGVGHCGGGQGPGRLDLLTPMMAWVEGGLAPDAILTASGGSSSRFGQPDGVAEAPGRPEPLDLGVAPLPGMTRPVWPWPATAVWSGSGAVTDGSGWSRGPDAPVVALRDWAGADFLTPYTPKD